MRYSPPVELSGSERVGLLSLTRSSSVVSVVGFRARIVLTLGGGMGTADVARDLGTSSPTVRKWRDRYFAEGVDGLWDYERSGRPPIVDEAMVVAETLTPPPVDSGLMHWSSRGFGETHRGQPSRGGLDLVNWGI